MQARLHVENPANEKLVTQTQPSIDTPDVFFDTRALLLDAKLMTFEIGVEFEVFPNVVAEKDTGRWVIKTV